MLLFSVVEKSYNNEESGSSKNRQRSSGRALCRQLLQRWFEPDQSAFIHPGSCPSEQDLSPPSPPSQRPLPLPNVVSNFRGLEP